MHVELIKLVGGVEILRQKLRLVMELGAFDVPVHFLEADHIGVFLLDHVEDPFQAVFPVAAANSLMDVITQKSHGSRNIV